MPGVEVRAWRLRHMNRRWSWEAFVCGWVCGWCCYCYCCCCCCRCVCCCWICGYDCGGLGLRFWFGVWVWLWSKGVFFFFFFFNDGFGDLVRKLVKVFVGWENKSNKRLKAVCLLRKKKKTYQTDWAIDGFN